MIKVQGCQPSSYVGSETKDLRKVTAVDGKPKCKFLYLFQKNSRKKKSLQAAAATATVEEHKK